METVGMSAGALGDWLCGARDRVEDALLAEGALLFRGATIGGREDFEHVARAYTPDLRSYVGGGSPRTHLGGRIYTSTEYPAQAPIPLHCEASYLPEMPKRIWFYCHTPSAEGGETPIGDMRGLERNFDASFVERLKRHGVRYVSNLHNGQGFGKSWMQAYETNDRAEVEARLQSQSAAFEWTKDGLRVETCTPAMRVHSRTGEEIWLNQLVNWHPAHLGPEPYRRLISVYGSEDKLPKCAFYGDGAQVEHEHVLAIAEALRGIQVAFPWRAGDILLLDNERIAHGRRPYRGERSVYVAMA
jgi:alpha-ketoglutarate-dependent taurine dioxygenase